MHSHALCITQEIQSAIHQPHHLAGYPHINSASYLDSELEGLVQLKYAEKKKEEKKKHNYKKKNLNINEDNIDPDDFPLLEEDSMCPICYEGMDN